MTEGITIEGLETLKVNMGKVDRAVSGPGLLKALNAGALVAEGRAKRIARDKKVLDTGFLISAIQALPARATVNGGEAKILSAAEYSIYNEFGTPKMAARPFMRPAIDEGKAEIQNAVSHTLNIEINKAI